MTVSAIVGGQLAMLPADTAFSGAESNMQRTGKLPEISVAWNQSITRSLKEPEASGKEVCTLEEALAVGPV